MIRSKTAWMAASILGLAAIFAPAHASQPEKGDRHGSRSEGLSSYGLQPQDYSRFESISVQKCVSSMTPVILDSIVKTCPCLLRYGVYSSAPREKNTTLLDFIVVKYDDYVRWKTTKRFKGEPAGIVTDYSAMQVGIGDTPSPGGRPTPTESIYFKMQTPGKFAFVIRSQRMQAGEDCTTRAKYIFESQPSSCTSNAPLLPGSARKAVKMIASPRIVGGMVSMADEADVSFMAAIVGSILCSGTVIAPRFVLTAGHCRSVESDAVVYIGGRTTSEGKKHTINQIILHPSFVARNLTADVALIELNEPATTNRFLRINSNTAFPVTEDSGYATVSGYGRAFEGWPEEPPFELRHVTLPMRGTRNCRNAYREAGRISIADIINGTAHICAGIRDDDECARDSCMGDSGGPLTAPSNDEEGPIAIGIVSFGSGCAHANRPGVYARLSSFSDWIASIAGSEVLFFLSDGTNARTGAGFLANKNPDTTYTKNRGFGAKALSKGQVATIAAGCIFGVAATLCIGLCAIRYRKNYDVSGKRDDASDTAHNTVEEEAHDEEQGPQVGHYAIGAIDEVEEDGPISRTLTRLRLESEEKHDPRALSGSGKPATSVRVTPGIAQLDVH